MDGYITLTGLERKAISALMEWNAITALEKKIRSNHCFKGNPMMIGMNHFTLFHFSFAPYTTYVGPWSAEKPTVGRFFPFLFVNAWSERWMDGSTNKEEKTRLPSKPKPHRLLLSCQERRPPPQVSVATSVPTLGAHKQTLFCAHSLAHRFFFEQNSLGIWGGKDAHVGSIPNPHITPLFAT